ncbi:VIT family protein [Luteococcus sediminum]|uniref:VIT1/CCC1 transporter family protein n=1 Tax=Luteococcus sp. TaxID=1969402 RepID=UPI00373700FC
MTSQASHDIADGGSEPPRGHAESTVGDRLNWLRAAVLGANDGIVSVAALLIGVAGAHATASTLLTAGVAGISSGALSMGVGEYVSVSAQRDSEKALVDKERTELEQLPQQEMDEMAQMLQELGVRPETARQAAAEIHEDEPLAAHTQLELGIDPEATVKPVEAALASTAAFTVGGLVPLLAVLLAPHSMVVPVVGVSVLLALALTGVSSARLGHAPVPRAVVRNVVGGLLAMAITFGIGRLFGATIG